MRILLTFFHGCLVARAYLARHGTCQILLITEVSAWRRQRKGCGSIRHPCAPAWAQQNCHHRRRDAVRLCSAASILAKRASSATDLGFTTAVGSCVVLSSPRMMRSASFANTDATNAACVMPFRSAALWIRARNSRPNSGPLNFTLGRRARRLRILKASGVATFPCSNALWASSKTSWGTKEGASVMPRASHAIFGGLLTFYVIENTSSEPPVR